MLRWRDSTARDWREETLSQGSCRVPVLMDAEVWPPDQSEVSILLYQPMRSEYYLSVVATSVEELIGDCSATISAEKCDLRTGEQCVQQTVVIETKVSHVKTDHQHVLSIVARLLLQVVDQFRDASGEIISSSRRVSLLADSE